MTKEELIEKAITCLSIYMDKVRRPMERVVKHTLNPNQFWIIFHLKVKGDMSMTEIADEMYISKQQATQTVDKLIELEYVKRAADEKDRRKINISITERGSQMLESLKNDSMSVMAGRMDTLSNDEIERLGTALEIIEQLTVKM